jgi:hypothetical protein
MRQACVILPRSAAPTFGITAHWYRLRQLVGDALRVIFLRRTLFGVQGSKITG